MQNTTYRRATKTLFAIITATLFISGIYALFKLLYSYDTSGGYPLMLTQCVLGIIGMILPALFERYLRFALPYGIRIMYYVFIFCAIFLGEVLYFYYAVPFWDSALHTASSVMLTLFAISIPRGFYQNNATRVAIKPIFIYLFAFCFALSIGALWEIYEFTFDAMLGLNMQKFSTQDGQMLVGRAALFDTMKDIIVDALAALITSAIAYILDIRKEKKRASEGNQHAG